MHIEGFTGADFEPLSRIIGATWHAQHGKSCFWQGADELCECLSNADKGYVAKDEAGETMGCILVRSPRSTEHNGILRTHWIQQRMRLAAMATAFGIDSRADAAFLEQERAFFMQAQEGMVANNVGLIELLILKPESRGMGIGRRLFDCGAKWLKECGTTVIRLYTDDECNWQFYEHVGMYCVLDRPITDDEDSGMHQYIFERKL